MNSAKKRLDLGEMRRFQPFCSDWGISRGGAIDRFYIDRFMKTELVNAKGDFLECGGQRYRDFVASVNISRYEVVDVDPSVPCITICADIQQLHGVKSSSFDVVVCTQVLQYVEKPEKAVEELRRTLKTGGRLLLTTPFIEKDCIKLGDRWRFTQSEVRSLLYRFRKCEVRVAGNLFVAACYWMGLGTDDLGLKDLNRVDESFYQVVLAKAVK